MRVSRDSSGHGFARQCRTAASPPQAGRSAVTPRARREECGCGCGGGGVRGLGARGSLRRGGDAVQWAPGRASVCVCVCVCVCSRRGGGQKQWTRPRDVDEVRVVGGGGSGAGRARKQQRGPTARSQGGVLRRGADRQANDRIPAAIHLPPPSSEPAWAWSGRRRFSVGLRLSLSLSLCLSLSASLSLIQIARRKPPQIAQARPYGSRRAGARVP